MTEQEKIELAQLNKANDPKLKQLREEGQKLYLTAVYDKRAKAYQNLITTGAPAYAVRGFMDAAKDTNNPIHNYPDDFRLELLGTINSRTGEIKQGEVKEILLEARTVVPEGK